MFKIVWGPQTESVGSVGYWRKTWRDQAIYETGWLVLPEYQGQGGPAILYAELYRSLKDARRFKHDDVVQISEFNASSLNELRKFGVEFFKTHHIYRKAI